MFRKNRLATDARGATAIEYALIVALIAVAVVSGMQALGTSAAGLWSVSTKVADAISG